MRRGLMNAGQAFHLKLAAIALTTSTAIVGIAWPRMSASKILPARWRGKSRGAGTDQLNRPGDNNRSQLTCNRRSAMESRVFLPSAVVAVLLGAAVGAQAADLPVAWVAWPCRCSSSLRAVPVALLPSWRTDTSHTRHRAARNRTARHSKERNAPCVVPESRRVWAFSRPLLPIGAVNGD